MPLVGGHAGTGPLGDGPGTGSQSWDVPLGWLLALGAPQCLYRVNSLVLVFACSRTLPSWVLTVLRHFLLYRLRVVSRGFFFTSRVASRGPDVVGGLGWLDIGRMSTAVVRLLFGFPGPSFSLRSPKVALARPMSCGQRGKTVSAPCGSCHCGQGATGRGLEVLRFQFKP